MTGTDNRSPLVPGAPVPLYQQLSDLLREEIRRGRYGPLDRLPSEHELVRAFAISRITACQALVELERAGSSSGARAAAASSRVRPWCSRSRG